MFVEGCDILDFLMAIWARDRLVLWFLYWRWRRSEGPGELCWHRRCVRCDRGRGGRLDCGKLPLLLRVMPGLGPLVLVHWLLISPRSHLVGSLRCVGDNWEWGGCECASSLWDSLGGATTAAAASSA